MDYTVQEVYQKHLYLLEFFELMTLSWTTFDLKKVNVHVYCVDQVIFLDISCYIIYVQTKEKKKCNFFKLFKRMS